MLRSMQLVVVAWSLALAGAAAAEPEAGVPAESFTGLGIGDFQGAGSIAEALRRADGGRSAEDDGQGLLPGVEFRGLAVQGPNGRDLQLPIAAEVRSRIDRFDVAAGLQAQHETVAEGPSQWVGRIGLSHDRPDGSDRLELRTTVGRRSDGGLLGLEVGPRLERRLRRGTTFFIDGKAQAQAARSPETGWWSLPGTGLDQSGAVGVAAQTGLTR